MNRSVCLRVVSLLGVDFLAPEMNRRHLPRPPSPRIFGRLRILILTAMTRPRADGVTRPNRPTALLRYSDRRRQVLKEEFNARHRPHASRRHQLQEAHPPRPQPMLRQLDRSGHKEASLAMPLVQAALRSS